MILITPLIAATAAGIAEYATFVVAIGTAALAIGALWQARVLHTQTGVLDAQVKALQEQTRAAFAAEIRDLEGKLMVAVEAWDAEAYYRIKRELEPLWDRGSKEGFRETYGNLIFQIGTMELTVPRTPESRWLLRTFRFFVEANSKPRRWTMPGAAWSMEGEPPRDLPPGFPDPATWSGSLNPTSDQIELLDDCAEAVFRFHIGVPPQGIGSLRDWIDSFTPSMRHLIEGKTLREQYYWYARLFHGEYVYPWFYYLTDPTPDKPELILPQEDPYFRS